MCGCVRTRLGEFIFVSDHRNCCLPKGNCGFLILLKSTPQIRPKFSGFLFRTAMFISALAGRNRSWFPGWKSVSVTSAEVVVVIVVVVVSVATT